MPANASVLVVAPESNPVFRPFDDSFLNGLWLYDNDFPPTECRNERETRGWWQALHAEAASDFRNQPGYSESRERNLI